MLPCGAVSSGVFPGLAWSAYKLASPAMGVWAARSRGVLQVHTSSTPAAHSVLSTTRPDSALAGNPSPPHDAAAAEPNSSHHHDDTSSSTMPQPESIAPHAGMSKASIEAWAGAAGVPIDVSAVMYSPPVYSKEYMESIRPVHIPPKEMHQRLAFATITAMRKSFDIATGYHPDRMNEARWLQRIIFLETTAGVPGMVGGMLRHLRSLRLMQRDQGWINTLLEEAENERMHLLTFMGMRQPGRFFRSVVIVAQGVMFNLMFVAYLLSPKFCHSLVGYLEEEAVKTYTHAIKDVDAGRVWAGQPAPPIAQAYWKLPPDATMRDLLLAVRADEACHSHVNHTFAGLPQDEVNPFTRKGGDMP